METHTFSLLLEPIDRPTDEVEDALYEEGCGDALLSFYGATPVLDFEREADSFEEAIASAMGDVRRALPEVAITRVGPDDLVNAAEIATRCAVSREAVRLWSQGERGAGNFPPPTARIGKSLFWSWLEVSEWLHQRGEVEDAVLESARCIASINAVLERTRVASLGDRLEAAEDMCALDTDPELHRRKKPRTSSSKGGTAQDKPESRGRQ